MPASQQFITRPVQELLGRHLGYGFAGIGVSTAIGNYTETDADLPFPGGLIGLLDWARTYNSRSTATGELGAGWSTTFSASLTVTQQGFLHHDAGPVQFHDIDGRVLPFTPIPAGGFTRPQDLAADLTRNADGTFTLTYNSGEAWSFDASGRLTGKALEGQSVTLEYNTAGLLLQAAHSAGQQINFSYDGNGQLTQAEANDGRTVSYAYAADGTLSSVTLPGGGIVQYATSNGLISRVTDPDGNLVVANTYAAGLVSHQDFAAGGSGDFGYDTGTGLTTVTGAPGGERFTFQANTDGRMTRVTDPYENTASFSYGDDGLLTEAVTPGGTQLTQSYDTRGNILSSGFGGSQQAWTYDGQDRVVTATNPVGGLTQYEYDGDSHAPSRVTAPGGAVTQFSVADGLLTGRVDADGYATSYAYDDARNLIAVTGSDGEVAGFQYDPAGNLTEIIEPDGAVTQFEYDPAGRVTAQVDPAGGRTSFAYSPGGLLLEITDPEGATVGYTYDAAGSPTAITSQLGATTTYSYDANGNLVSTTSPAGAVSQFSYDLLGRLVSATNPAGAVASYTYDADGRTASEETPLGMSQFKYDARGNPVTVTNPGDAVWRYVYDAADRVTEFTDPADGIWQSAYDEAGNLVTSTNAVGAVTRQQWSPAGRLDTVTDPLGNEIQYARDSAGQVTEVTDGEGGITRYVYDSRGRRISVTTPAGLVTQFRYDAANRVVAVVGPRAWITRFEYDKRGDRTAEISPSGAIRRLAYDAAGHLTRVIDANHSETEYTYDEQGNLIAAADAKGAVSQFGYDASGREISSADPLGRVTRREYDTVGDLIAVTDPDGGTIQLEWGPNHQITRRTGTDGTEVTFGYDAAGRRISMTDPTGTTRYGYDQAGKITEITEPDGAVFTLSYDAAGRQTALSYPDGLQVSYSYDGNSRLIGVRDSRAGDAVYALDPDGRLLTEQLPGRQARRYHYQHGLLHAFLAIRGDHPVADVSFTHDPDGRIATEREGDWIRQYRYDPAGQLTGVSHLGRPRDPVTFTYDAVGNRTVLRRGNAETRYLYDDADQLISYEAHGRRTELSYDGSGRLVEEGEEGDQRRVLRYDGFGQLAEQLRHLPGGMSERIKAVHNGTGLVTTLTLTARDDQRDEERAALVRYRWSAGQVPQIWSQRDEPNTDDAERDLPGRLNADFTYGRGRVFGSWEHGSAAFHKDAFGSAIRTEDTEAWVQAERYEAYGAPEEDDRSDRDHDDERLRPPELPRFGYRGELALGPEIYLRARGYNAELGRFTSRDPETVLTGPSQARNPYAYANNDPLLFADPLGKTALVPANLLDDVLGFAPEGFAEPCDDTCLHPPNTLNQIQRCFQGKVCLYARGEYEGNESALAKGSRALNFLWSNHEPERAAQAVTINALNANRRGTWGQIQHAIGHIPVIGQLFNPASLNISQPNISADIDWEVGQPYNRPRPRVAPNEQGIRIDILTGPDNTPCRIFEVRSVISPRPIQRDLTRYINYARRNYRGLLLESSTELETWADTFRVNPFNVADLLFVGGNTVYVWGLGEPPGHIYFAEGDRTPSRVRAKTRGLLPGWLAGALGILGLDPEQGTAPAVPLVGEGVPGGEPAVTG
jgi:RHS repeat-associated protein